jgi:hypothetical protein
MPQRRNNRRRKPGPLKNIAREAGKIVSPILSIPKQITSAFAPAFSKGVVKQLVNAAIPAVTAAVMGAAVGGGRKAIPAAYVSTQTTRGPRQVSAPNGNMKITHSEYIGDVGVRTPNEFDLQYQFGLNPGNVALFPWLSQVASRFDTFRFKSLRFRYETVCGTGTPGVVMMAIDTDASDDPPTQSQQMLAYKGAVESVVYAPSQLNSGKAELTRLKTNYVLTGLPPPNTDIKTYDVGNFYLAVIAPGSTNTLGRLHVDYTVELMTPQIVLDPPSASITNVLATTAGSADVDCLQGAKVQGNMPVYLIKVTDSPPTYHLYVALSGSYQLSMWMKANDTVGFDSTINVLQGPTDLFDQWSPVADSNYQDFQILYFQNPQSDAPVAQLSLLASTPNVTLINLLISIIPMSSSVQYKQPVIGQDFVSPPGAQDPRKRFGRAPVGNIF